MLSGSQRVSAKMAQSGMRSNAPSFAMSDMTEDWTSPPRLMTVKREERISRPPWCGLQLAGRSGERSRRVRPALSLLACLIIIVMNSAQALPRCAGPCGTSSAAPGYRPPGRPLLTVVFVLCGGIFHVCVVAAASAGPLASHYGIAAGPYPPSACTHRAMQRERECVPVFGRRFWPALRKLVQG